MAAISAAAVVLAGAPPATTFAGETPPSLSLLRLFRQNPPRKPSILSYPPTQTARRHRGSAAACLPSSPDSPPAVSTRLFVSGLSFRTTDESLRNAFQDFGELVDVNLVMDRVANRPRGFAFLRYATEEESRRAIEGMHGKFLDGRVIFVEVAKPRSELRPASKQPRKLY